MKFLRKALKYFLYTLLSLFGLILIAILVLQIPAIQTKIAKKGASYLENTIGTKVNIKAAKINFIDYVSLKGVYLEDQKGDTLLYANKLSIDIGLFNLLRNKIDVDFLSLDGVVANLEQDKDSVFNFQYIIDSFASKDTTSVADTSAAKMPSISVDKIKLTNIRNTSRLIAGNFTTYLKELTLEMDVIDLENQLFAIDKLKIDGLASTIEMPKIEVPKDSSKMVFPLDSLPIKIKANRLSIINSSVNYTVKGYTKMQSFNNEHIDVAINEITIKDIALDQNLGKANIKKVKLNLDNKVYVNDINGEIELNRRQISWDNLYLATQASTLKSSAQISYAAFIDLINLDKQVTIDIPNTKLELAIEELLYFVPSLKDVKALKNHLNDKLQFETKLKGNLSAVSIDKLEANLGANNIILKGLISNFTDINTLTFSKTQLDVRSTIAEIKNFVDLSSLKPTISRFGNVKLSSNFSGSLNNLLFNNLLINTDGDFKTNLSGTVKNALDINNIAYQLKINTISTSTKDLYALFDSLPELVDNLGNINYTGTLTGTMTKYDLRGKLNSKPGSINTDFNIAFNDSFTNAIYKGKLALNSFHLGDLLDNDSLGRVSANIQLDGQGLNLKDLDTRLDLGLNSLQFNGYTYTNGSLHGSVKNKEFIGRFDIKDNNIAIDFDGLVKLDDSIPKFDFTAKVEKMDLYALNLTSKKIIVKMIINSDLSGATVDDIQGKLIIHNIELFNGKDYYRPDSFIFMAQTMGKNHLLTLQSPVAEVKLDGNFKLANMDKILLAFADNYFPFSQMIASEETGDYTKRVTPIIKNEQFNLSIRLIEPTKVTNFFDIPLQKLDYAQLDFELSAPNNLLNFEFYIPEIIYNDILIDSIYITANNNNNKLSVLGSIDSIAFNESTYIPQLNFSTIFKENSGIVSLTLKNDSNQNALQTEIRLSQSNKLFEATVQNPLWLNAKKWEVQQTKGMIFGNDKIQYPSLSVTHENEKLAFNANEEKNTLSLENFNLGNLISIIQLDSTKVEGAMNGIISLNSTNGALQGDMKINDTKINNNSIGNFMFDFKQQGAAVDAKIALTGNENDIKIEANYGLQSKQISGTIDIGALYINPFEPFFKEYVTNTTGYINGKLALNGSLDKPVINGKLKLTLLAAKVVYLGEIYSFDGSTISLKENAISTDLKLVDGEKKTATLKGDITHNYFKDLAFNLNFKGNNFKFLNTKKSNDALYYGILIADVDAKITGNLDLPRIVADVKAVDKTDLTVQLISEEAVLSQENYIIFIDGTDKYNMKELDSLANARYQIESLVDLTLNLEMDKNSIFTVVIDPVTQDRLTMRGDAKLLVYMTPSGELTINGTYIINSGSYRFSYQELLKRNFDIIAGSKIVFNGSPYNARMDVKAKYTTKASVLPLLSQDIGSLSDEDRKQFKKQAEVDVILMVKGSLKSPDLSFDIKVLEYSSHTSQLGIASSLQRIKQNESDLNKQVFSLMLFNSFTGDQSKGNISNSGTSTAVRSLGNLINRQLNDLIGSSGGFQVNFGADNYNTGLTGANGETTVTELNLGVSQTLFNDRVTVSVGSNVDLENSNNSSNQNLSNVSGDFVLIYKITDDGKYRFKVFQRTEYDALNESNFWKTGVGISFKTMFGKRKQ